MKHLHLFELIDWHKKQAVIFEREFEQYSQNDQKYPGKGYNYKARRKLKLKMFHEAAVDVLNRSGQES